MFENLMKASDEDVIKWLRNVYDNGLSDDDLVELTRALSALGKRISFPFDVVDKHSTGGIGDKVSLIVVPVVAACGVKVAKLSGRGLGFTGGTVDKLESIPGFNAELSIGEFMSQVEKIGCAISGQSKELAPAEGKFYALRNQTNTIDSIPLIASSIVSKKVAGGARAVLYDVKHGNGAFMKTKEKAMELAEKLVWLSEKMGLKAGYEISDMSQPLGVNVGNSLEVIEAIETLKGKGPADLFDLSISCAGAMLALGGVGDGERLARESIANGSALEKFREMIVAQGGQGEVCDDPARYLRVAPLADVVRSPKDGVVSAIDARGIGECVKKLGGGRVKKEDKIDYSVGVRVLKKVGDQVSEGDTLIEIYANKARENFNNEIFSIK